MKLKLKFRKYFFCDLRTNIDQGQAGVGHPASRIAESDPQSWLNFKDSTGDDPKSGKIWDGVSTASYEVQMRDADADADAEEQERQA